MKEMDCVEVIVDFPQHVRSERPCILVWFFRIHTHIHVLSVLWHPDCARCGRIQIPMIQAMVSERQTYRYGNSGTVSVRQNFISTEEHPLSCKGGSLNNIAGIMMI